MTLKEEKIWGVIVTDDFGRSGEKWLHPGPLTYLEARAITDKMNLAERHSNNFYRAVKQSYKLQVFQGE